MKSIILLILGCLVSFSAAAHTVSFVQGEGKVDVLAEGLPIATYVYNDPKILRPYLCHIKTLDSLPVTRNHPPIEGEDKTDHADMHPGIWLGLGDISGEDFWRNKGKVRHVRFVEEPVAADRSGSFAVENSYQSGEKAICKEICRIRFEVHPGGYFLLYDSIFSSESGDFSFGDQEEMGLGIRMATPLSVLQGGTMMNSEGKKNEKEAWGQAASWCDYSGQIKDRRVGVILMPHPMNFRKSWFHARDYGLLVGNPFGQNAMTGGESSSTVVKKGEEFRLRYGVYVYSCDPQKPIDPIHTYSEYLGLLGLIFDTSQERQSPAQIKSDR